MWREKGVAPLDSPLDSYSRGRVRSRVWTQVEHERWVFSLVCLFLKFTALYISHMPVRTIPIYIKLYYGKTQKYMYSIG